MTIHEPPKETAKGESIALDQDRENGSNHEIIMSKDEVPTSQVKVDSLRRVDSVHDKMARVLFKTLNYIEEDNHNRAHRKPSMVEVTGFKLFKFF